MGIIFISHSAQNSAAAIMVRDWLRANGWSETFLDLDPARGLAPGHRWLDELRRAGRRCAAVVAIVSPDWAASKWCQVEFLVADQNSKRIFPVMVAPTAAADLPIELAQYQIADVSTPDKADYGFEQLRWGLRRAGLAPHDFPWPPPDEPDRAPYRGLLPLEQQDAAIFFGRDSAITAAVEAMQRMRSGAPERMLVILGASGAGKSSFLRAGILARLERSTGQFLVLPVVRSGRNALTGTHGMQRAFGLAHGREDLRARFAALRQSIIEQSRRFSEAAREPRDDRPVTVVLPIDQAEELLTTDHSESSAALTLLQRAYEIDSDFLSILAIRSDNYSRLQAAKAVHNVVRQPFDLPRLSLAAFKEVIEGPGRLARPAILFEQRLTERLVDDIEHADALPLLAFTLQYLVDRRTDGPIGLEQYERELGGLKGAITKAVATMLDAAGADPLLPQSGGAARYCA